MNGNFNDFRIAKKAKFMPSINFHELENGVKGERHRGNLTLKPGINGPAKNKLIEMHCCDEMPRACHYDPFFLCNASE